MKYCPKCNKEYASDTAQFCNTCGSALIDKDPTEIDKGIICPSCGKQVPNAESYCSFCGSNLKLDNKDGSINVRKEARNGRAMLIVIVVSVVAVIGAIGIRLYNTYLRKDTETTQSVAISLESDTYQQQYVSTETNKDNNVNTDITSSSGKSLPVITSATTLNGVELGLSNVSSDRSFEAYKAIDGDGDTCWCVNTNEKEGAGAQLRIALESVSQVSGFKLVNGNQFRPYEDIYSLNGQVKDFTLKFSNGKEIAFTAEYNAGDPNYYQDISFSEPIETEYIILIVHSSYVGTKYNTNVCLTEFCVY